MLFKLSIKNIRKSMKDYAIYFMTLILGVAIFYIFNSLDSQQAMSVINSSTMEIIELMVQLLSGVSVFVSFIMAFLIVYANNFLIKRRKKEFGVYMTLGMGKGQISRILVGETFLIGLLSLAVGLLIGVLGGQFMSVLVVKMFEGTMTEYTFVFSKSAFMKTILYFGIMYVGVLIFNTIAVSRCRLIDLISAGKKSEQIKVKNPFVCIVLFLISVGTLSVLYYLVSVKTQYLNVSTCGIIVFLGAVSTFLFFWSLSGFLLGVMRKREKFYLKNLNSFVLRQINSQINTTVFAMTIICLMLFITICVLSSGLGMNYSFRSSLKELTPVDVNVSYMPPEGESADTPVSQLLGKQGFDVNQLRDDYVEMGIYNSDALTMSTGLGDAVHVLSQNFLFVSEDTKESIIRLSDYNRLAKLYGKKEFELARDEYIVVCDFEALKKARDLELKRGQTITLDGKTYMPKYEACQDGYYQMMANHANPGFYVLPDESVPDSWIAYGFLAANYKVNKDGAAASLDEKICRINPETGLVADTKTSIIASSTGLSTIVTFIALYLGVIFLISGAAILALKELSESSDNRKRYEILRKIGADDKMTDRALMKQIGIFFFLPLGLACVHSIFGLQFVKKAMITIGEVGQFESVITTAVILLLIYGGYYLTTYFGSRQIIRGK